MRRSSTHAGCLSSTVYRRAQERSVGTRRTEREHAAANLREERGGLRRRGRGRARAVLPAAEDVDPVVAADGATLWPEEAQPQHVAQLLRRLVAEVEPGAVGIPELVCGQRVHELPEARAMAVHDHVRRRPLENARRTQ